MSKQWTWLVVPELYRIEWIYLGALTLLSCLLPRRSSMLSSINRALRRLANRRRTAVLVTVMVVLVGRLALMGSLGIPRPTVHDEFGYLLTADTFAHGRMTNPTPALWKSLQTMHIFQTPTYQSQYTIGYPALLAAAQIASKNPWWAVYLTTALMCGAITWMLQAWLPPYWALLGGLFVAVRFGLFSYWMNSFWGGSLTALGGALVFGALPRVTKLVGRWRYLDEGSMFSNSVLMALGLVFLATTRPYEGFMICLPAAALFLHWLFSKRGPSLPCAVWHAAVPCIVLLGLTTGVILYYQHRVTGHALQSPYDVATKQFRVSQAFVFQKPLPLPHYDNLEMRYFYVHYEAQQIAHIGDPYGLLESFKKSITWYWEFYVGPLMTLPLFASVMTLRDRRLRLLWASLIFLAAAMMLINWVNVHYLAPGLCLFVLLLLDGIRHLKIVRFGGYAAGARIIRVLPVTCLLLLGFRVFAFAESDDIARNHWPPNWAYSPQRLYNRERIEDRLNSLPGQHLVLVRYHYPFHNYHHELVFNGADLLGEKILWARSLDVKQNCMFIQTYRGKKLWIVDEWEQVTRLLTATEAQICDPLNFIYAPNQPSSNYFSKQASAAASHGSGRASTHAPLRPPVL